jgi:hypothetical protein
VKQKSVGVITNYWFSVKKPFTLALLYKINNGLVQCLLKLTKVGDMGTCNSVMPINVFVLI